MTDESNASLFESGLYKLSAWLGVVSALSLAAMMILTTADVSGRYFFNAPIFGAYELIGMLLVCAGPLGMALCEKERSHIVVSLVVDRFPLRIQAGIRSFAIFLSLGAYTIISWRMFILTIQYASRGRGGVSPDLGISLAPVAFIFAVGAAVYTLVLLIHFIQALAELKGGD